MFGRLLGWIGQKHRLSSPSFPVGDAQGFWTWYADNADKIAAQNLRNRSTGSLASEKFLDAVQAALHRFNENLAFEIGVNTDGVHEFVVSADGIREFFPSVTKLVAVAPHIEGHRILAFRQRSPGIQVSLNGVLIGLDDVTHEILSERETALNVRIFLPYVESMPESHQKQIMFLLMDSALGEYDVATGLGYIEHRMLHPGEISPGKPLSVLANEIDARSGRGLRH